MLTLPDRKKKHPEPPKKKPCVILSRSVGHRTNTADMQLMHFTVLTTTSWLGCHHNDCANAARQEEKAARPTKKRPCATLSRLVERRTNTADMQLMHFTVLTTTSWLGCHHNYCANATRQEEKAPRPTKKRPCATLSRSAGRRTNTADMQLKHFTVLSTTRWLGCHHKFCANATRQEEKAPRPTKKRPCATLSRSVGRRTNTAEMQLMHFTVLTTTSWLGCHHNDCANAARQEEKAPRPTKKRPCATLSPSVGHRTNTAEMQLMHFTVLNTTSWLGCNHNDCANAARQEERAPRPTKKRPCATLSRSVGRRTNTAEMQLMHFTVLTTTSWLGCHHNDCANTARQEEKASESRY